MKSMKLILESWREKNLNELEDPRSPSPMSYEHEGAADDFRQQIMNLVQDILTCDLAPAFSISRVADDWYKYFREHCFEMLQRILRELSAYQLLRDRHLVHDHGFRLDEVESLSFVRLFHG